VAFEILPAIDVAGGRLVSVSSDGIRAIGTFGGSPLEAARAFVDAGARWLHVVDVDRADGRVPDQELLTRIAALGAFVQASGGVVSEAAARAALDAGARRVVLSSAMLADREALSGLVSTLGERAVVGIEATGDRIRPRTAGPIELPLAETTAWLRPLGAPRYLVTGLSRVGGLAGPDLDGLGRCAAALGRPVLAAGGIRGPDDVVALRELGPDVVEGAVVGKALYEGVDLVSVLAVAG
jgi:phosphoribosyl isomerase A